MKTKLLVALALILAVFALGYSWYQSAYGGEDFYVQVDSAGKKTDVKTDNGETFSQYVYETTGYSNSGVAKELEYTTVLDAKPLRQGAFLKIVYNKTKGVISWVEVKQSEIPAKALEKLK
ncbi:MAG: YxeA family protein [Streptococcaceae bacterium]|jgi:uncharacterized protein (TIGR01655 family)|nr:YxeA family protein [Streptococcaceae bacterium]